MSTAFWASGAAAGREARFSGYLEGAGEGAEKKHSLKTVPVATLAE
jgi:hypothetical protein